MNYSDYPDEKVAGRAQIVKLSGVPHLIHQPIGQTVTIEKLDLPWFQQERSRLLLSRSTLNDRVAAIQLIADDVQTAQEI
jgi:urease accessory protein UreE